MKEVARLWGIDKKNWSVGGNIWLILSVSEKRLLQNCLTTLFINYVGGVSNQIICSRTLAGAKSTWFILYKVWSAAAINRIQDRMHQTVSLHVWKWLKVQLHLLSGAGSGVSTLCTALINSLEKCILYTAYIYTVWIHISCINSHVPITTQVSWKVKCVMFMCLVISTVPVPKGLGVLSHSMVILTEPANKIQAWRQMINQEIVSMFLQFLQNWHFSLR